MSDRPSEQINSATGVVRSVCRIENSLDLCYTILVMSTKLVRSKEPLNVQVEYDSLTEAALLPFDRDINAPIEFFPWCLPELPDEWGIGLIVGSSGSGKSTLLSSFGPVDHFNWVPNYTVVSHFDSPEDAWDRLYAVGLNSIPTWQKPYEILSTGERFRADLARSIGPDAVVDEFTSVVNRPIAKSASVALRRFVNRYGSLNMVFATCHSDITEYLRPDWIINTDEGTFDIGQYEERKWWMNYESPIVGRVGDGT